MLKCFLSNDLLLKQTKKLNLVRIQVFISVPLEEVQMRPVIHICLVIGHVQFESQE